MRAFQKRLFSGHFPSGRPSTRNSNPTFPATRLQTASQASGMPVAQPMESSSGARATVEPPTRAPHDPPADARGLGVCRGGAARC